MFCNNLNLQREQIRRQQQRLYCWQTELQEREAEHSAERDAFLASQNDAALVRRVNRELRDQVLELTDHVQDLRTQLTPAQEAINHSLRSANEGLQRQVQQLELAVQDYVESIRDAHAAADQRPAPCRCRPGRLSGREIMNIMMAGRQQVIEERYQEQLRQHQQQEVQERQQRRDPLRLRMQEVHESEFRQREQGAEEQGAEQ